MRKYILIKNIEKLPKTPGVYFLKNKFGEIFYIGKAANIRSRAQSHIRDGKILQTTSYKPQANVIEYIETINEIEALLKESYFIKKLQPKMNIRLRDDKKYFYVGITTEQLPRIFITHQPIGKDKWDINHPPKSSKLLTYYLGPYTDGKAIKMVMKYLSKLFPYYLTNPKHPLNTKKHSALPCSRCHIKLCPGPSPKKSDYQKNIKAIKNILNGKRKSVISDLKTQMRKAAKQKKFEKAAKLRDIISALENIFNHKNFIIPWSPEPREQSPGLHTEKYLQKLLQITSPIKTIEGYDISNNQGKEATGSMIRFTARDEQANYKPDKSSYRKFNIQSPASPDDYLMMAELVKRRFKHKEWPYPDLILIDGGKGQLNSALQQCQISNVKCQIIALAKQKEELYLPNRKKPIPLKNMPQNVQNLLKHIRDEAHRFAVSHHRKLHRNKFKK